MFIHTVYFWLKAGSTDVQKKQLLTDCRELLAAIPTVRKLYVGVPAGTARGVVDNTYGVGLTVLFDDAAGHDAYQPHPLHDRFIERNKETWDRVMVYDVVE